MSTDYGAMRAAAEARKTLSKRLRETPATGEPSRLMGEAADAIDHLHRQIAQLQQDMRDEQREAQRDARSAVAEARWQASQGEDYGSY